MPLTAALLLDAQRVLGGSIGVVFLVLFGADGADLEIVSAELTARVEDGVDMETRGGGPSGKLSKAQDQFLLEVVGEVVLGTEEHDAALRNWVHLSAGVCIMRVARGVWSGLTGNGQVPDQVICVGCVQPLHQVGLGEFTANDRRDVE